MSRTTAARARTRRALRSIAAGATVVAAAIIGTLAYQSASSSEPSPSQSAPSLNQSAPSSDSSLREGPPGAPGGLTTAEADGVLPAGATVFDDEYAGIANLDPALLHALREAATDAADDGITFSVNSGWRSREYQDRLLRQAVSEYGSEAEAARWVATADTSAHVSGDAVDIEPSSATTWLSEHGAKYGLCQIYANEPWHYELRPEAIGRGCPPMYADPTHDPRMQR
ncbi:M15 family metallopeptidase [Rhodococcus ruber]|uniref:M15 family metallopeptidase n=1 Tax=Rhodococcus ruber TaxID=1830 RepID=UPI00177B18FE|nr:M15 family metallopeptidase [Rhodococcus ruber]MBD8053573.1 M15 family metallopeptidase [Rhodococcus ruber]